MSDATGNEPDLDVAAPDVVRMCAALCATPSYDGHQRHLGPSGDEDALMSCLSVIDTAVLPRRVEFRVGPVQASLLISGRRVRAVSIPGTADAAGSPANLPEDPEAATENVLNALRDVTDCEGALTVIQAPLPATDGAHIPGQSGGVSADAIARLAGIDLNEPPASETERFCIALGEALLAMVLIEDDEVGAGIGTEDLQTSLANIWQNRGQDGATLPENPTGESTERALKLCESHELGGASFLYAKLNSVTVLGALTAESTAQVARAWWKITA